MTTADLSEHVSVIMPALNEAGWIGRTVARVQQVMPGVEILVVDGGSEDDTVALAAEAGARVILAARGRGPQCNAGAAAAAGDLLLFLHADTLLPDETAAAFAEFSAAAGAQIGAFRLRFDLDHWLLRLCGWLTRFDSVFTRFGDQGLLLRATFFRQIGGFPDWPLLEDVHLLRCARRHASIRTLPATVTTSARRFRRAGILRTQLRNGWLLTRYLLGWRPEEWRIEYTKYYWDLNE